jgi:hypothetical protein
MQIKKKNLDRLRNFRNGSMNVTTQPRHSVTPQIQTEQSILEIHQDFLSMVLQPFVGPSPLFQFFDVVTQSVALLGRGFGPSQERYLHTE